MERRLSNKTTICGRLGRLTSPVELKSHAVAPISFGIQNAENPTRLHYLDPIIPGGF